MKNLTIGQRYMSLAEPELGLGLLTGHNDRTVLIEFLAVEEVRNYGIHSAPIKRVTFEVGDEISDRDGKSIKIESIVSDKNGLLSYQTNNGQEIHEEDIDDKINFIKPEQKLFNQCTDNHQTYLLRHKTNSHQHWLSNFPYRGMVGPRVQLLPHQLYIVNEITKRLHPRVILADEVGLGKTIEAGLILHKLITTNRVKKALILLPEALCFQWFLELYRKYNLTFDVVSTQDELENAAISTSNLTILSTKYLCLNPQTVDKVVANNYDLLIVDEVHKIDQTEKNQQLFDYLKTFSQAIKSILFLSATPQMNGLRGHFDRLNLIDPNQFQSFDKFSTETQQYIQLSRIVKKIEKNISLDQSERDTLINSNIDPSLITSDQGPELIREIISTYGHGRVFFRNTRKSLHQINLKFPQRMLKQELLLAKKNKFYAQDEDQEDYDHEMFLAKMEWLKDLLESHPQKKILLICRSKKLVLNIEKKLKRISSIQKIATFHSELSLMARDRQAAYFSDPDGAQILLCSEIGSEGRNFQFASHLILFDLPFSTDKLEQRIGRLDRIGQKNDITIHLPLIKNSWEEILFSFYHYSLDLFTQSINGSSEFFEKQSSYLNEMLDSSENWLGENQEKLDQKLEQWKSEFALFTKELEEGRDVLVEINSFHKEKAQSINFALQNLDVSEQLQEYLEHVFTVFGVDIEELSEQTYFIKPGDNMFISSFPHLDNDGFTYTTNRQIACENEEIQFMTWDHPLVIGIMDYILGEQVGNATIVTRKKEGKPKPFLEMNFKFLAMGPLEYEIEKYAPPVTKRILLNLQGENFSQKFSSEKIDAVVQDANFNLKQQLSQIDKSSLTNLIEQGQKEAESWKESLIEESIESVEENLSQEVKQLEVSQRKNRYDLSREIELLSIRKDEIILAIKESKVYLDSFRFIY